jgi:dolichol-phosphate mannosyltransferase
MRSDLLSKIDLSQLKSNGYIFQLEVNYKAFCLQKRIKEVPITFYERNEGYSKMDGGIIFEALFSVMKLRLLSIFGKLV